MQTRVEEKSGRRIAGADIARVGQGNAVEAGSNGSLVPKLHSTSRRERRERRFTTITTTSVTTTTIGLKAHSQAAPCRHRKALPQQEPENTSADWQVLTQCENERRSAAPENPDDELSYDDIALIQDERQPDMALSENAEPGTASQPEPGAGIEGGTGLRSPSPSDRRGKRAFKRCQTAARQGDAQAQLDLALRFAHGLGVKRHEGIAAKWFARAARQGQPTAQFHLGRLLASGTALERDDIKALAWFTRAAESDEADALYWLGLFHEQGRGGLQACMARAYDYYRAAAQQGHDEAVYRQACCLWHASGVERDLVGAVALYMQAAERGNVDALWKLGVCYERGWCVRQKDPQIAFKSFELAAHMGNAHGQFHLARCYYHGIGVQENLEQACAWWLRSEQDSGPKLQEGQSVVAGACVDKRLADMMADYELVMAEEAPRIAKFLAMAYDGSQDSDDSSDQRGSPDSAEGPDALQGTSRVAWPIAVDAEQSSQAVEVPTQAVVGPSDAPRVVAGSDGQRLPMLREASEPSSPGTDSANSEEGETAEDQALDWHADFIDSNATYG